jgi:hypothetical protein
MMQRRYGNDFAPAAAVAFAIMLAHLPVLVLARAFDPGRSLTIASRSCSVLLALALFSPVLRTYEVPRIRSGIAAFRGEAVGDPQVMDRISRNVAKFARKVRAATPDTEGFLDQRRNPEYGIIAEANLGHVLHYYGRRATATDPMWSYIGPLNWKRSLAFYGSKDESKAIAIANQLMGRYVVTARTDRRNTVSGRLHHHDGRTAEGSSRLERFRLLTESAPGEPGFGILYERKANDEPNPSINAYKLFEVVQGAIIEVHAESNARVTASVTVESPSGRRFIYAATEIANAEGVARIRVPYSTGSNTPVHATGPFRISSGFQFSRVDVNESQVREGGTVSVTLGPGLEALQ